MTRGLIMLGRFGWGGGVDRIRANVGFCPVPYLSLSLACSLSHRQNQIAPGHTLSTRSESTRTVT